MKSVPNILSAFRICLVPVFFIVYFRNPEESNWPPLMVYAVASLTDILDGYIARKYRATSNLGRVLDPAGDKLMQFAVLTCITVDWLIPLWALLLFVLKELTMLLGGLIIHRRLKMDMPPSNFIGKTATVLFFVVCAALMVFPGMPRHIADTIIAVAIGMMFMALGSYVLTFTAVLREARKRRAGE